MNKPFTYTDLILDPLKAKSLRKTKVYADFNPTQCLLNAAHKYKVLVLEDINVNSKTPFICSYMGEPAGRYPIILPCQSC